MATIPTVPSKDALWKFDQAVKNLTPADPKWTPAEAIARSALAQILMAEGLVLSAVDIEKRVSEAAATYVAASDAAQRQLARWTFWQAVSTVILAGFTIAQVVILLWFPGRQ